MNLIEAIKKAKVWKQGKASSAQCPLEQSEFQGVPMYFEQKTDVHSNLLYQVLMKLIII